MSSRDEVWLYIDVYAKVNRVNNSGISGVV